MGKNGNGNGKRSAKFANGKVLTTQVEPMDLMGDDGPSRDDWQMNHWAITNFIVAHLEKNNTFPSNKEIAAATKLTVRSIEKHKKYLKFSRFKQYTVLSDRVLMAVFNRAIKDSTSDAKLWFQLVEGWSEKFDHNLNKNDWRDFEGKLKDAKEYKGKIKVLTDFLLAGTKGD